ncbi:MAG: hypothetical protein NTZ29_17375 [Verrucomicrobia bacterium]|nr:hypothetical protein [Verrucomicrobiota bacterium]
MQNYLSGMFFAEIKPQIEQLPHDELLKAMAYLKHLLRAENPAYQRELAQRPPTSKLAALSASPRRSSVWIAADLRRR